MFRKQFVEVISSTGMLVANELRVITDKSKGNKNIGEFDLLAHPKFDEKLFAKKVSEKYNLNLLEINEDNLDAGVISLISKKQSIRFRAIPFKKEANKMFVCIFDPSVTREVDEIRRFFRKEIEFALVSISDWKKVFELVKDNVEDLLDEVEEVKGIQEEAKREKEIGVDDVGQDVIQFVNRLLVEAFIKKASDIHVESYEKIFRIRIRVDGSLIEVANPAKHFQLPVISRLKIMASMDIAEKRLPQDGRIKLKISGVPIDFRVSSLPTLFGEKIVLRLLDESNLQLDMTKLGFEEKQLNNFKEGIKKPYGMCLVVGPTGSGKTTTLYSALSEMNDPKKNIVTAEDPVEFNLEGINQVNVKSDIGLTFASALKSFLRQDPDVIMVGEIRDLEVGGIAVEAALTGHLVLSTLHTNDAPATVSRLLNMGIEPFLLVASLNVIVAQRLCRKICSFCREQTSVPIKELTRIGFSEKIAKIIKIYKGKGCERCSQTGYRGRIAIYEVLIITRGIKDLIIKQAPSDILKAQAIREGMKTLRMSALIKVAQGLTTVEEALNCSAAD